MISQIKIVGHGNDDSGDGVMRRTAVFSFCIHSDADVDDS